MTHKILRVRIRTEIYKKFQKACIDEDLSVPKQMEKLIGTFLKEADRVKIPFCMIEELKKEK